MVWTECVWNSQTLLFSEVVQRYWYYEVHNCDWYLRAQSQQYHEVNIAKTLNQIGKNRVQHNHLSISFSAIKL